MFAAMLPRAVGIISLTRRHAIAKEMAKKAAEIGQVRAPADRAVNLHQTVFHFPLPLMAAVAAKVLHMEGLIVFSYVAPDVLRPA
jgi:hypothetical protein